MKYTDITCFTADRRAMKLARECGKCGARVEQTAKGNTQQDPTYCPHCGHKFKQRPETVAVPVIVSLLNVMVETHKPASASDRPKRDRQKKAGAK